MGHKTDMRAREPRELTAVVIGRGKPVPVQIAPKPVEYAFPTKVRCPVPICRVTDTVRTGSNGPTQYRRCKRCGKIFSIKGNPV